MFQCGRSSREERCLPSPSLRFTALSPKRIHYRIALSRRSPSREGLWANAITPEAPPDYDFGGDAAEADCPRVSFCHGG